MKVLTLLNFFKYIERKIICFLKKMKHGKYKLRIKLQEKYEENIYIFLFEEILKSLSPSWRYTRI